jgi:thiol-disulfide isomerase/thioredoxin
VVLGVKVGVSICLVVAQSGTFASMKKYTRTLVILALVALISFMFYKYRQPRFLAGDPVPDFEVSLISGERAKLSDLKGKYVLLQFWGSWCGPCRQENPELAALYQKYHARGFEIFSIGIETNPTAWKNAILQDGLTWKYHAMEAGDFDGGQAKQFNIKSIPTTFLLNPEGIIMGVSLKPEYINKMLSEKI